MKIGPRKKKGDVMKPFRAIYTPICWDAEPRIGRSNAKESRTVLVVSILPIAQGVPQAIFIDSDGRLRSDNLECFSNCVSSEWRSE